MRHRLIPGALALAGLCGVGLPARGAPAPAGQPDTAAVGELDGVIRQSIAVARTARDHERAIGTAARDVAAANRDLTAKQQALDDTRNRAAALLSALERLAYSPPEPVLLATQQPIDRIRGGMVMAATVPALSTEARRLITELLRLATLRDQITGKEAGLARDRQDLAKARDRLAQLAAKREELRRQVLHEAADSDPRAVKAGTVAVDLPDLIGRGDAWAELRDRETRLKSAKVKGALTFDPTRPKNLREVGGDAAPVSPVAGATVRRFGETGDTGKPSAGALLGAPAAATIVTPYDGRIDYAGPFRGYGLILIIDHGGGYHSVLAGLGRADAKIGEWVLAGEPVGALPDADKPDEDVTLYFELRRDGRPIDPLATPAEAGAPSADHKVSE